MPPRTQQRPSSAARTGRRPAAGGSRLPRTTASSPSTGRFNRPAPARKPKSSSALDKLPFGGSSSKKKSSGKGLAGLAGALGGGAKKKGSGGGIGKNAGGLAALAGVAGLAMKNRSKITSRLGRGKQSEPEVVAPATPPVGTNDAGHSA